MENLEGQTGNSKAYGAELEFDLENMDFKPVTKGLGFSHQKQALKKNSNYLSQKSLRQEKRQTLNTSSSLNTNSKSQLKASSLEAVDLSDALGKSQALKRNEIQKEVSDQLNVKDVNLAQKHEIFFAWAIDVILLVSTLALTIYLFAATGGVSFLGLLNSLGNLYNLPYVALLFSVYFFTYFCFLDIWGTVGKLLMGIRVTTLDNSQISLSTSVLRTTIVFISFLSLGIPSVFDFQGRLSETKVIKER